MSDPEIEPSSTPPVVNADIDPLDYKRSQFFKLSTNLNVYDGRFEVAAGKGI